MRRSRLVVALAVALIVPAGSHLIRPAGAAASAPTSILFTLDGYVRSSGGAFYWAAEGTSGDTGILRGGHDCQQTKAEVSFRAFEQTTEPGGVDHSLPTTETWVSLEAPPLSDPGRISRRKVPFTAHSDDQVETAVETVTFRLMGARAPDNDAASISLIEPREASVFIVDSDGPTRFRLSHGTYSQSETDTVGSILVIRAGPATGAETVGYTIEPSDTNPTTSGEDYTAPASGELSFAAGERVKTIPVAVINDKISEPTESFVVSLTGTQLAAEGPTSANFSILDNDRAGSVEEIPPSSRFHHPKHKNRYDYDSRKGWYLREIHVFTSDQGSGVVRAQMALRKKMQSGKCSWWAGSGFKRRPCAQKKWLRMRGDFDFYFYRIKELRPTVGTNIKNYTAFSRAVDGAGNVENTFKKGRNANTFTISR